MSRPPHFTTVQWTWSPSWWRLSRNLLITKENFALRQLCAQLEEDLFLLIYLLSRLPAHHRPTLANYSKDVWEIFHQRDFSSCSSQQSASEDIKSSEAWLEFLKGNKYWSNKSNLTSNRWLFHCIDMGGPSVCSCTVWLHSRLTVFVIYCLYQM